MSIKAFILGAATLASVALPGVASAQHYGGGYGYNGGYHGRYDDRRDARAYERQDRRHWREVERRRRWEWQHRHHGRDGYNRY